jgi:hypothetical protein
LVTVKAFKDGCRERRQTTSPISDDFFWQPVENCTQVFQSSSMATLVFSTLWKTRKSSSFQQEAIPD